MRANSSTLSFGGVEVDLWTRQLADTGAVYYFNRNTGASQWHTPNDLTISRRSGRYGMSKTWSDTSLRNHGISKSQSDTSLRDASLRSGGKFNQRTSASIGGGSTPTGAGLTRNRFDVLRSRSRLGLAGGSMMRQSDADPMLMPSLARACCGVDCMTEYFIPAAEVRPNSGTSSVRVSVVEVQISRPALVSEPVLRVKIIGAEGLRDTDFMPGVDKSDPYCTCKLWGKDDTEVSTPVIFDCLDPVWECELTVGPVSDGELLQFTVYDSDAVPGDANAHLANSAMEFNDDSLGTAVVDIAEALAATGPIEVKLDDAERPPTASRSWSLAATATLRVEVDGPCDSWPSLVGQDASVALDLLKWWRPDLEPQLLEAPPKEEAPTASVVSWDMLYGSKGYHENFFGAYEEDAAAFKEGDLVEIFPNLRLVKGKIQGNKRFSKVYTFSHIGGPREDKQKVRGKIVRYISVQEEGLNVRDTMQWRRIPKPSAPGFHPQRVCLFIDPATNQVITTPKNG